MNSGLNTFPHIDWKFLIRKRIVSIVEDSMKPYGMHWFGEIYLHIHHHVALADSMNIAFHCENSI